jgi:hypothetical protein
MVLAKTLPTKAAKNPAQGPRITPSTGSKYIAQLRHKPKDIKYNITCKAAKTPIKEARFADKCNILQSNVIFYTTFIKFALKISPFIISSTAFPLI